MPIVVGGPGASSGGGNVALTPTAVKTGAYTANPGELVMVDASGGAVAITAPATGAGRSFAVKKLDASTNVVTVARAGSDTIGSEAATSVPIRLNDQATHFLSNGSNWVIPYNHLALNMLDARYVPATQRGPIGGVTSLGTIASGAITPDAASANHVAVTATGNLTLNAPAGTPAAGQSIRLEVLASGAQRVITFSGSLAVMTGLGTTLTIPSGKLGRIDLWNPTLLAGWSVVAANTTV